MVGVGELLAKLFVEGLGHGISDIAMTANFKVTSFSPNQGSIFGGTLITVTGEGFPAGENDRSMSINIQNTAWCLIEGLITATEFKCRVEDMPIPVASDTEAEFMVMLRLTLFAECTDCYYKFTTEKTPMVVQDQ